MRSAATGSILQECYQTLREHNKRDALNFVAKIEQRLKDLGLPDLAASPLSIEAKVDRVRQKLAEKLLENINASVTSHHSPDFPFLNQPVDAATRYFHTLKRHKAHTLLLIRCNTLFKPFQYITKICPHCRVDLSRRNGWEILQHLTVVCQHYENETICRELRQSAEGGNRLSTYLARTDWSDAGDISHVNKILGFCWRMRMQFKQAVKL
jgi:hypothetical protein